jgi:predicted small secreted protein
MKALTLAALLAAVTLAGCNAQGGKDIDDGLSDGGDSGLFPNDGSTPTTISEGGTVLPDGNFVCEAGIQALTTGATTQVATGGLVGGLLTTLLNTLGGATVTELLNSVSEPDNVIDNKLETFATYSLTLGLLAIIDSVDLLVHADQEISSGNYAVFALRFPKAVLEASLVNSLTVSTFLNDTLQETMTATKSDIDLLGLGDPGRLFVGLKTTKTFDTASIRLTPAVLSANVGEAMYVHELCTKGHFVTAP